MVVTGLRGLGQHVKAPRDIGFGRRTRLCASNTPAWLRRMHESDIAWMPADVTASLGGVEGCRVLSRPAARAVNARPRVRIDARRARQGTLRGCRRSDRLRLRCHARPRHSGCAEELDSSSGAPRGHRFAKEPMGAIRGSRRRGSHFGLDLVRAMKYTQRPLSSVSRRLVRDTASARPHRSRLCER